MFSTGEQAGFEATIIRPDGTRFNEYDVKHSVNEDGVAVTECWLECEDDAVFQIKIERNVDVMTRYKSAQWSSHPVLDGRRLSEGMWNKPKEPYSLKFVLTDGPGKQTRIGRLAFSVGSTTANEDLVTAEPGDSLKLGTIEVRLRPGTFTLRRRHRRLNTLDPVGTVHESAVKLARIIKSTDEQDYHPCRSRTSRDFRREHESEWQIFRFKYHHRASLESMGVIAAPPPTSARTATSRKRVEAGVGDPDRKPDIKPIVGASKQDQKSRDQDRKPDIRPVVGASKQVQGFNDQDRKPDIKPVVSTTTALAAQIPIVIDDSDEDECPEEEAPGIEAIRKHKAAIEALEQAGRAKGKGKKRAMTTDVKVEPRAEGSRRRVKLEMDQVIAVVDSD